MSTNWIERALREIPETSGVTAAKAAERTLTAATAAPTAAESEKFNGAEKAAERRRQQILAMLDAAPATRTHVFRAYEYVDQQHVIVAFAIRGVGSAEMTIERDQWDALRFAELLEKTGGTA